MDVSNLFLKLRKVALAHTFSMKTLKELVTEVLFALLKVYEYKEIHIFTFLSLLQHGSSLLFNKK